MHLSVFVAAAAVNVDLTVALVPTGYIVGTAVSHNLRALLNPISTFNRFSKQSWKC